MNDNFGVNLKEVCEKMLENVAQDRDKAKAAYELTVNEISKSVSHMSDVGPVMVKSIETLIKANEQLIKLTAILVNRKDTPEPEEEFDPRKVIEELEEE